MGHPVLLNLNGRPVYSTECSFRILHKGAEVAVVDTQAQVVQWFDRKRAKFKTWLVAELSAFGLILCRPAECSEQLTWTVQPVLKSELAVR